MRQFIKEHPWRLEIVPGLIILFAIIWLLIFRSEMNATQAYLGKVRVFQQVFQVVLLLFWAAYGAYWSHKWVKGERQKKYFIAAPLTPMVMCLNQWYFFGWHLNAFEISYHHVTPAVVYHSHLYGFVWLVLIPVTGIAQAIVEWTRPYRPQPQTESVPGASDVRPGDPFYYREVLINWPVALIAAVSCLLIGLNVVMLSIDSRGDRNVWPILTVTAIAASATWLSLKRLCIVFVISKERVLCRNSASRFNALWAEGPEFSIRMSDIEACSVFWIDSTEIRHPFFRPDDANYMRPLLRAGIVGACLRLETSDGKAYLLGMKNPETACKLIQTAIEEREKSS